MKFLSFVFAVSVLFFVCSCNNNNDNDTSLNGQDIYFMQQASYSNHAEISAGNIAAVNGSNDSVRMFGTMMVTDHTGAQSQLDTLAMQFSQSIPSTPDSAHQAMTAMLQSLSGGVFDTTYIGAQVRDHTTAVALFQQEINEGNNRQVKNYASTYLPVIQEHLQKALNIQQQIH